MSAALAKLRATSAAMRSAAREEGISPTDPLGRWIEQSHVAAESLATLIEEQGAAVASDLRKAVEADVERGRQVLAQAEQLTRQLEKRALVAEAVATTTHQTTATDLVKQIIDSNTKAMRETIDRAWSFTESRFHRRRMWTVGFAIAAGFLLMFAVGMGFERYETTTAVTFFDVCTHHIVAAPDGTLYCQYNSQPPSSS